jgi:hypothetical protein
MSAHGPVCDGCLPGCPLLREPRGAGPANAMLANHGCREPVGADRTSLVPAAGRPTQHPLGEDTTWNHGNTAAP